MSKEVGLFRDGSGSGFGSPFGAREAFGGSGPILARMPLHIWTRAKTGGDRPRLCRGTAEASASVFFSVRSHRRPLDVAVAIMMMIVMTMVMMIVIVILIMIILMIAITIIVKHRINFGEPLC
jgi:hypothetical protein